MKTLIALSLLFLSFGVVAAEDVELQNAHVNLSNNASLQRGAQHFVTYCLGCHSAKHIRYKRIAIDFGMTDADVLKDIAPVGAAIYDQMHSAMNAHDANKWFGTSPPDLSLIARSRGADWLYSYLKSYYVDPQSPRGVNNLIFPDTAMPNPLWQLQGEQHLEINNSLLGEYTSLVIKEPGTLSKGEFDIFANDLVNFLVYVGEPMQIERERIGKYVLFFLLMFVVLAYLLKKEYWKDVH